MEKIEFPKWKYHAEKEARIVGSKEAEAALGDGWVDSPADIVASGSDDSELVEKIEEILSQPKKQSRKAKE